MHRPNLRDTVARSELLASDKAGLLPTSNLALTQFQQIVWEQYATHGRHDLPWRQPVHCKPYDITVSELMLQQTQVARVIPKFQSFLASYPTVAALAQAELGDVVRAWQGLGYNRRAKYLWQTAQRIMAAHGGVFPHHRDALERLPGIGPNTAGAIIAYAYDRPAVFVETNIRTVYIYHFFTDMPTHHHQASPSVPTSPARRQSAAGSHQLISDTLLRQIVAQTFPAHASPRAWYWALMDYGSYLKQTVGNLNRFSTQYAKQSTFDGSHRQVRGRILRLLSTHQHTYAALAAAIGDARLDAVLDELVREQLVQRIGDGTEDIYCL